jgi:hypothetical protein
MKKLLIVPAMLALLSAASAESRFFFSVGASYLRSADGGYRQVYGDQAIYPEVSGAVRLVGGFCLTGSAGKFAQNGQTPGLGLETRASQSYVSIGLGYILRASRLLCFEAEAGLARLSYREDALDVWIKGQRRGFKAEGAILLVPEDERVFFGLRFGYIFARIRDLSFELAGPQPISLGGIRVAVCVGIQLFGNN